MKTIILNNRNETRKKMPHPQKIKHIESGAEFSLLQHGEYELTKKGQESGWVSDMPEGYTININSCFLEKDNQFFEVMA